MVMIKFGQWYIQSVEFTFLNLQIRLSTKWGGAQFIPTIATLSLLLITSRHSLKLSPDAACWPSTQLKHIHDGTQIFSSSSSSTIAWAEKKIQLGGDEQLWKCLMSPSVGEKFPYQIILQQDSPFTSFHCCRSRAKHAGKTTFYHIWMVTCWSSN